MKFDEFKPGLFFFTATGKWMVTDVIPDSYDANGFPTPVIMAVPMIPNQNLEKLLKNPRATLETEFYEWDMGGCDLENRFSK